MTPDPTMLRRTEWGRALRAAAAVALLFSGVVATLLAIDWRQGQPARSVQSPALQRALSAGRSAGGAGEAATLARELDLLARHATFANTRFRQRGALLLTAGLLLALLLRGRAAALTAEIANPRQQAVPDATAAARSRRRALLVCGSLLLLLALFAWPPLRPSRPRAPTPFTAAPRELPPAPAGEEWPSFRGARGLGISEVTNAPLHWDGASGQGVAWRVALTGRGNSAPIVHGGCVLLTEGDATTRAVLAFDAASGALRWRREVAHGAPAGSALPAVTDDTGLAAPTMAGGEGRLFALFGSGDLAAFTLAGEPLWHHWLGDAPIDYGHASSLLLAQGLLVVQWDRPGGGFLRAYEPATGRLRWEAARPASRSWSSPLWLPTAGAGLLLLNADGELTAYDPADGTLRWHIEGVSGEVAPSPAWWEGRIFVAQEYARLAAFDLRGETPRESWQYADNLPDVASPVAWEGLLWLAASSGIVTCLEGESGRPLWEESFDDGFYASPLVAAGRLYLIDRAGVCRVLAAGRDYQPLATNALGEACVATPALTTGRLFIRGERHLFAIGAPRE